MKPSEIIKKLRATNSRLEKEAIVQEAWEAGCKDFFAGVLLCLDGRTTFGIKQIPDKITDTGNESATYNDFVSLATKLSKRELTGHAARDAVYDFVNTCDKDEWNLFYRLILLKDFKSGFSESTTNKVLKKIKGEALKFLVTEYPYQRCCLPKHTDVDSFSWKDGVLSQTKSDGMFVNINHNIDGSIDMLSRGGKLFPLDEFGAIVEGVQKAFPKGTQSHGELLVFRDGKELPREIGNGKFNSVAQGGKLEDGDLAVVVIWDQIPLDAAVSKGTCKTPYKQRLEAIAAQVKKAGDSVRLVDTRIVHTMEEAMSHYREMLAAGKEGTIIKEPTAVWKDGTSKFQVKLKLEAECELEIVGFNKGSGKNAATFGSIIAKTSDGELEVSVSGFEDVERVSIWAQNEALVGTIMTVRSNSLMKPSSNNSKYSLFLPRFVEFRKDKTEADSLQKVIDQFESVLK